MGKISGIFQMPAIRHLKNEMQSTDVMQSNLDRKQSRK